MPTCFPSINQMFFSLRLNALDPHLPQCLLLASLPPQHLGIWPLRRRTLAFYMHFQIWLCYSTVWHFQRSQPLLVHLVPLMSMFLCSTWVFPGQMSEVWALLGQQMGLIGITDQFLAGPMWSFLPVTPSLPNLINAPVFYSKEQWRIKGPTVGRCVGAQ